MELLKDYDVTIQYHLGKANVVADALNRKVVSMGSLTCLSVSKRHLAKEIQTLESKFMQLGISERGGVIASIEVRATFIEEIKAKQFEDENLEKFRKKIVIGKAQETTLDDDGVRIFKGRICVPRVDNLIEKLLAESHAWLLQRVDGRCGRYDKTQNRKRKTNNSLLHESRWGRGSGRFGGAATTG
ncbi:uncharacterized protein LOC125808356 [Solanum verrucosum]|uniref:uncharacterized protein LOC125808356 n=1 Tax=Solanum verrucosum TaxID=315347 RepID=UPI0020D03CA7|nr:uncharacterized protein LOC125808356 [Solanum verrucosum]